MSPLVIGFKHRIMILDQCINFEVIHANHFKLLIQMFWLLSIKVNVRVNLSKPFHQKVKL